MKRSTRGRRLRVLMAALPVAGVMTVASAAVVSGLTAGVAAADTPVFALACSAAGVNVALPTNAAEGVLSPSPANSGAAVSLVANSADVPNSGIAGTNLLNGPDTGLGFVTVFPATLEALITAGSSVGFSGSVPLTVTGGTGSPVMNISGTFLAPTTYPTNPGVVLSGTMSGAITAGASGTVSVALPQFTTTAPLTLSLTGVSTVAIPLTCTDAAAETIASATITPTPFISVSPSSVAFTSATNTQPVTVSGGNWGGTSVSLTWSSGTDTSTCAVSGGTITQPCTITAGPNEVGTNQAPFSDNVVATGTNGTGGAATAQAAVQLTPFVSLNTFCVASATGLTNLQAPSTGTSPENPLTITRGGVGAYPAGATPKVGCDPKQQIDADVIGSNLYIWESQTGPANSDAAHVLLSPVELGLDTNSSAEGGNLPPCSPFTGTCSPAVNNGQFDQALGQLNTVTVQDDRGTLSGWTVTGQMESNFTNQTSNGGPAVDNVIPADFLTWAPAVALATPGSLPANNANTPGCPDQTPAPTGLPTCTGPSGTPAAGNVSGGAPVNGTGATGVTGDSVPAEVFAGSPETLNNLQGSADVLCATSLTLAGGAAGGGGSFLCSAGLSLAVPPYVGAGDYRSVMDITILGF